MWQIFTVAALVFNAAEITTDKVIMVANNKLDTLVASFYRNIIFLILSVAIGATGLVGVMHLRFDWPLVAVGGLELIGSIFYTILLKKVEMTGAAAIGYIAPFLFLLVDVFVIRAPLNFTQILGILLLICGGLIFVIDPLTRRLKKQYTKYILAILLFDVVIAGAQYYGFKFYSTGEGLNEISFMVSVWFWVALGLLALVIVSRKARLLYSTAVQNRYLLKITASKSFDAIGGLFWFHALSLATVSQVNSFSSFEPLILLILLIVVQQIFKFKAGEDFTRLNLFQKTLATVILLIGAWLAN
jgi:drug/metabolite transporter (DMT)-like permease